MKLIKINKPQVSESKEVAGLLNCHIEYEIKTAKGRLEYSGPKLSPELWHQILSFFRWTNKEMQSESQVRLYVNHQLGQWGAWAFPQEARTGMSARELPVPETPDKARERFASWDAEPSDDWIYFGTVHHHCCASAFQSSTDEQNEWNQDGLHLTMGRMDAKQHDLHARLYLNGNCFEPDMNRFWPVEPQLAAKVPPAMLNELARFQMCEKITVDFPQAWRANLVDVQAREKRLAPDWDSAPGRQWEFDEGELKIPLAVRLDDAVEEIDRRCAANAIGQEQWLGELNALCAGQTSQIILETCVRFGVTPQEILEEVSPYHLSHKFYEPI